MMFETIDRYDYVGSGLLSNLLNTAAINEVLLIIIRQQCLEYASWVANTVYSVCILYSN